MTRRRTWALVLATVLVTALTAACGGLSGIGAPRATRGSLAAEGIDLTGQSYRVGGKNFPEQLILCKIQIAAIESVGGRVTDTCDIPGTSAARAALTSGQIDMYWSYTGTGWVTDLRRSPPIRDPRRQYEAVRDADAANGIVWTQPTPFDDTYAIGTTEELARQHGLRTTSDAAAFLNAGGPDATLCVESEFAGRLDGLPGFLRAYGIRGLTGPPRLTTLARGTVETAVAGGGVCRLGEITTTDGRLASLHLVALPDDRGYFPVYNASNTIRRDVVDRSPQIVTLSDEIARRLDQRTMTELNTRVSSQGQNPDTVARDWLRRQGLIGP